jgi:DNA-binding GntR family transcriptional regulator
VYELDTEFHRTLWQIADHNILIEVVSELRSRISRFLYEATIALPSSELKMHVAGHEEFIRVLKGGDVIAAKNTVSEHILAAKDRILTYCQGSFPPDGHNSA